MLQCVVEPVVPITENALNALRPTMFYLIVTIQAKTSADEALSAIQDIYIPEILPFVTREVLLSTPLGHIAKDAA